MLNGRLVRQFIAVAEELNFRKAAERLHMAQSPLSQAIKSLEGLLGVELLMRTNRTVALTPAGREFLGQARLLQQQELLAIAATRSAVADPAGRLTLGYIGSLAYDLMPQLVAAHQLRHPQVHVDLLEMRSNEQAEALRSGRLDVGLLRLPLENADGLATRMLRRDHFMVALPLGHRLVDAEVIDLADLRSEKLALFSRHRVPSMFMKVMTACIDAGFHPNLAYEVQEIASAIGVVASGQAVALIPSSLESLVHPLVVYRPLAYPASEMALDAALAWRESDRGLALQSFLGVAVGEMTRLSQGPAARH